MRNDDHYSIVCFCLCPFAFNMGLMRIIRLMNCWTLFPFKGRILECCTLLQRIVLGVPFPSTYASFIQVEQSGRKELTKVSSHVKSFYDCSSRYLKFSILHIGINLHLHQISTLPTPNSIMAKDLFISHLEVFFYIMAYNKNIKILTNIIIEGVCYNGQLSKISIPLDLL